MSLARPFAAAAAIAAIATLSAVVPHARQSADAVTVGLSEPSRLASVRVSVLSGRIVVTGGNRQDVLVTARGAGARRNEPPPGMQRLTPGAGLSITEENNQVTIAAGLMQTTEIEIQVPMRTDLKLNGLNNGDILVENVDGAIEVGHMNGSVRLTNVAGSVVANSHNGNVIVVLTRLMGNTPMAFTSFNGNVDVTLPPTVKANLNMRSDNGDVFTDFDIERHAPPARQVGRRSNGRTRIEVNRELYGTINGGGPEFELRTYNGNVYVRRGGP
jgi:DUF4097 and DUF4098 domain-containing protein YvlB